MESEIVKSGSVKIEIFPILQNSKNKTSFIDIQANIVKGFIGVAEGWSLGFHDSRPGEMTDINCF